LFNFPIYIHVLATSSSLEEDNAHEKDICLNDISGACQRGYCNNHHHTRLPYLWQININGEWFSFDVEENQKLEESYCNLEDVADTEVSFSMMKMIYSIPVGQKVLNTDKHRNTCVNVFDKFDFCRLK
jgi:hypothetical protein